jgi:hypothetical protein
LQSAVIGEARVIDKSLAAPDELFNRYGGLAFTVSTKYAAKFVKAARTTRCALALRCPVRSR